ncbi:peptide-methionine (R)-S-oxide reductase [Alteromonas sp. KS69]|jgi:peptide-methionine (R)-S-oxide reductase|uniref:Peptide methionine sulfoxide reductase MsrB n=2 Tax=Alteromonas TaxID=226 RepID=A0AAW7YXP4_9ALTE|nr:MULTISPECIES: peptide-methionine (R)-S-oxide reductase MsrB [Alteromonas]MBB67233.1 peptide-methionine (R)-S-oxide reductase [Rickettsiales bacterium]PHS55512.1 MAG: peptide-methionine (R)-S-oxide reductase [Alteromonas sp.]AEF02711.1 methionine sulfoxide reductase B [Alteromonas naphthalenivorans]AMJ94935.1 peptide methionine sulfoxide reductase [Alteromonas stellipolaris]ANB22110.1 peptide-methionine (R)-S-oxide reductase [Alteromonas stellipolaris]|tara:strand:+ start:125 stop:523 length:399 start_codon:yes stop_codon:yes gene_type:complete
MSEQKWQETLSEEEYRVCRNAGTERPFTGALLDEAREGTYVCKCCGADLFSSQTKFDAGCGWPSFFQQLENDNVGYRDDNTHGMHRVEIFCKQCDSHLGHVFPDGPEPSGQRYCVNSISLTFKGNGDVVVKG